jgi:integrase
MNRETDSFRAIARRKTRDSRASRFSRLDQYGWISEHLDDPHLADLLITTLERSQLGLRDQIIIRIACESGARITEILSITVSDWRSRGCQQEISFNNKSHRDQQKRLLYLKPETAKLLLGYVEGERKQYDVQHRDLKLLVDTDPLFLSRRQRAYSYEAFAANWKALCAIEGIALPLHGLRAWYVIRALREIDAHANHPAEAERLKEKLAQSMGWQNPAPLHKYESYLRTKRLAEDLNALIGACSLSSVAEPCILTCHICGLNAHLPKDIVLPSTLINLRGQDEKHQQEERRDYEE